MKLSNHIAFTAPIASFLYVVSGRWESAAGAFIAGVLIDADHLMEFWHDCGFGLSVRKFFEFGNNGVHTRHYIVFHSYELIPLFLIGIKVSRIPHFFIGMVAGLILHIFLDYVNITRRFGYRWFSFILFSFFFRSVFRFRRDKIDRMIRHIPAHEMSPA